MPDFISEMGGLELVFVTCAAFGTVLFMARLALMLIGGGQEGDADGVDGDAGPEPVDHGISESDLSFKALSLHGITAFFMMFGLVGWALVRQGNVAPAYSIGGGVLAGLVTIWVMKKLFQMAGTLQRSGTMNLHNAVGQEGNVYLTIRPGQIGKVQIIFQGRQAVLNATTTGSEEIKTGQRVRVVAVNADTLVVEKTTT
ncbi:MAG: hypothetical protein GXY44_14960 [Phycisphaerales bacterium]|nr:hypothetical protein [Phycisphaerales bacterium]